MGGPALLRLTLASRPDLVAQRLGIGRAEADVGLALANRYPDLFLVYQPYTFQDDSPLGLKSAHSWGAGVGVPVPLFNRNQGNIRRAKLNVTQTQVELAAMEERAIMDVRQAERQYAVTREAVARIERSLLPRARDEHDRVARLYLAGKAEELDFLRSESDFDLVVRQYRDTLVRHRRAMLRLNTAVGQRILRRSGRARHLRRRTRRAVPPYRVATVRAPASISTCGVGTVGGASPERNSSCAPEYSADGPARPTASADTQL